jgi:2-polyprenyl-6-methoxyphenol hydroxylase and related FAD-dependent oxidoreductases
MSKSAGAVPTAPVAVVGRGPVGMVVALRLAQFGVPSIVIDQLGVEAGAGSKAVVMERHAVEVLRAAGVGDAMLDEGIAWTTSRTFLRNRELVRLDMPRRAGELPRVLNIAQVRTEQLLIQRVQETPEITLLLEHRLTGLEVDGEVCRLQLEGPSGPVTVEAAYVVGADGARSTVRKLLGIEFRGYAHDHLYRINDVRARLTFPLERRFFFDPVFNPGRTVLIHPQGPDEWHIDFQLGPDADETPETPEQTRARLSKVLGTEDFEVTWTTTYRFKQLVADRFRQGRVFLAGDAAHLTSPYGARGLNSGLGDADGLAWRLAAAVHGAGDDALLDGYEAERRPAAVENLRVTGKTARFMSPRTALERFRRGAVLQLAARVPAARRWVNSGHFYAPAVYPGLGTDAREVRAIVPDVELAGAGAPRRLADLLSAGTTALFTAPRRRLAEAVERAGGLHDATGLACVVVDLGSDRAPSAAAEGVVVVRKVEGAEWWGDRDEDVAVTLVRPDRYPAGRLTSRDPDWDDLPGWYARLGIHRIEPVRTPRTKENAP